MDKSRWKAKRLVDICKIQYGYPFDSKKFCDDSKYPQLIRIRDVSRGYSETYFSGEIPEGYYIDKGDYLIGMDGEFNIAAWNSERALLNQRVCKITANEEAYNRFLYYNLRIILKQIEDETPFVTVKHLSAKRLNTVTIDLPPLSDQQHIVEDLDLLSTIIEKKKTQLNELDNLAQSLFYEMFGDPITNEKGWEVKKLEYLLSNIKYGTGTPPQFSEQGFKFIRATNIKGGYIREDNMLFISPKEAAKIEKCKLQKNDMIIVRSGVNAGDVCRISEEYEGQYAGYDIIITVKSVLANTVFLNLLMNNRVYVEEIIKPLTRRAAQPHLNAKQVKSFTIPLPPLVLQQQFASKIEAIEHQKELIKQSIKEVETLFNSRMDYYFN